MKILKIFIKSLKCILGIILLLIGFLWILDGLLQESEEYKEKAYQEWYNNLPENWENNN